MKRKFQNKTPVEILTPYGYGDISEHIAQVVGTLKMPCLNTALQGKELANFHTGMSDLKKCEQYPQAVSQLGHQG